MNRFDTSDLYSNVHPTAVGQVGIIPFQESLNGFSTLEDLKDLETVRIIKPYAGWKTPFFKFCGGMVLPEEKSDFTIAAQRELQQETGVTCPIGGFREILRTQKRQFAPHVGEFEVVLYLAFGCDFTDMKNPLYREVGDEDEESAKVRFGEIMEPGKTWPIPTKPQQQAEMFGLHLEWLHRVQQTMR